MTLPKFELNMGDHLKKILESWGYSTVDFFPKLILAIAVLTFFVILGKLVKKICLGIYSRSKLAAIHPDFAKVIAAIVYFFFLLSGVFLALEIMGLEKVLTKLLASAGVLGIIAGFAFQDIASNAFAGFLLKTRHPFKIGDWIQFNNEYGKVTGITLLSTSMDNILGQQVFIPNQLIYSDPLTNFSVYGKRRVVLKSAVSGKSDLEEVKAVAIDEIKKSGISLSDEPVDFYYTDMGDSSFNFELFFWIKFDNESEFYQARSAAIMNIKKRFATENISIASPLTT
ncbi:MAG: mechanosensitive ion channel [Chitinophagaceae bacterium]|nr:mechanosensitive ion channel [Chitinophagaceae bacterium]